MSLQEYKLPRLKDKIEAKVEKPVKAVKPKK